jgi:carbonic anhydrase
VAFVDVLAHSGILRRRQQGIYPKGLKNNRLWAAQQKQIDPNYFKNLVAGQKPLYLYIGCSDSRMALTKFMQVEPGEVFVHRNIANQISLTDINFLSVLEYAINHL